MFCSDRLDFAGKLLQSRFASSYFLFRGVNDDGFGMELVYEMVSLDLQNLGVINVKLVSPTLKLARCKLFPNFPARLC
jgi:hypothetical protein